MSLPEAPTNVTVVPASGQATVSWNASSSAVTGYKIFCNPDNKLPNLASAGATSLVVTNLKNGTPHTFRVHAMNENGMSASSVAVPSPPPAAPKVSAVRGPDGSLVVTIAGKPQKGSSISYYNLLISPPAPSAVIPTNIAAAPVTFVGTATITGLTLGVSYTISANATSPTGTSPAGAAKPVIAATVPDAPVVTGVGGIGSAQISWTTPANNGLPIIGYTITYAASAAPTVVKTKLVNLQMIKGLLRNSTYTFSIRATNLQGNSLPSDSLTVTTT